MAGRTRARRSYGQPTPPTAAVIASAVHYKGNQAPKQYGSDKGWQQRCYRHYGICGEARYAATYYGNALSRCRLNIKDPAPNEDGAPAMTVVTSGAEVGALGEIFANDAGQAQILSSIGVHMTIAGECFLVGRAAPGLEGPPALVKQAPKIWEVVSPLEMNTLGEFWTIRYEGYPDIELTENDDVIRIWRPDPKRRLLADSPFKSLLPVLDQIEQLTLHLFSQIRSKLISAGVLFISQNAQLPKKPAKDGEEQELTGAEAFMVTLAETMSAAIADPASPAANVPTIVSVPDEVVDKHALLEFWTKLDEQTSPLLAAAIHRFALGMDLPAEMVEGMSSNAGTGGGRSNGVSHWGAWQIEEQAIKVHIEPMLEILANNLTVDFLRIVVPGTRLVVGYDTTPLRLRPDRSKEALELYDRGLLNGGALLRETGFDPKDAMSDEERKLWLTVKIAGGSSTPDQVAVAAKLLGVDLPSAAPPAAQEPREAPQPPSLMDHPTRPRTPAEQPAAALIAACNAMALSALQRVGNRLVQKGIRPPGVQTYAVHTYTDISAVDAERLVADAFPMANEILDGICEPAEVMPLLHAYVLSRIATRKCHSREDMAVWLNLVEA